MHGNVFNWIEEIMWPYEGAMRRGNPALDIEQLSDVRDTVGRAIRGGSFVYPENEIRSAYRLHNAPSTRNNMTGFRPARTLP